MKTMRSRMLAWWALLCVTLVLMVACATPLVEPARSPAGVTAPPSTVTAAPPQANGAQTAATPAASAATTAAQAPAKADYVGEMTVTPANGLPGTRVTTAGAGLPANAQLDLLWYTVKGEWDIRGQQNEEYHGRKATPVARTLAKITTDEKGRFEHVFTVPEDYGFIHDVAVVQNGVIRNKAAFSIDMQATITPRSGPVGTPITIEVRGLGWQRMENPWQVLYDNKYTGFLSGNTTGGYAKAVIPAVGQPGKHIIHILEGPFTFAYRNIQQSPVPYLKPLEFEFEITPGAAVMPPAMAQQQLPLVKGQEPAGTGPALWLDVAAGPVDTPVTLQGKGLPAGQTVELLWGRVVGNRVSGSGWQPTTSGLAKVTADSAGRIIHAFKALDDLGGPHRIEAVVDGKVLAATAFDIKPSVTVMGPTRGPVGTEIYLQIKGVGWTETANIYTINYDNSYIGYSCGFNSQGTINLYLKATGEPGWHFVDLVPAIYKGKEPMGVETFRIPQLTYADDHPGEKLPGFRFAFEVTP